MLELKGKYGTAKVFTDKVEETAVSQIINLMNQSFVKDAQVRIMPDVHAGAGCVIGFTANLGDVVIPNLVGVDIGCGMTVTELCEKPDLKELDEYIHNFIPAGFSIHQHQINLYDEYLGLLCLEEIQNIERVGKSLGTLGGGNHFIEIGVSDSTGMILLVVHSGSRNLGKQVADLYQKKAIAKLGDSLPHDLCYLEYCDMGDYLYDMEICQKYASANRDFITATILAHTSYLPGGVQFETVHNYVNFKDKIIRKGAVSAYKDELLIIPMNMRDGSLICKGKGNADWNYSAPHGAGRTMSRGNAKRSISAEDYRASMDGIYSTCINHSTLDEAPMAYKPMEEIVANIADTAEVVDVIKPIYNFKAGGE
jgi:tRNA-splicing ligase RtcB